MLWLKWNVFIRRHNAISVLRIIQDRICIKKSLSVQSKDRADTLAINESKCEETEGIFNSVDEYLTCLSVCCLLSITVIVWSDFFSLLHKRTFAKTDKIQIKIPLILEYSFFVKLLLAQILFFISLFKIQQRRLLHSCCPWTFLITFMISRFFNKSNFAFISMCLKCHSVPVLG